MFFPKKYVQRIHEMLPESEWEEFFKKATKPLPKTIRIANNFTQIPKAWHLKPAAGIPQAFFIERDDRGEIPLGKTLEHFTGKIYIASLSSLLPPIALNPQPGESVLDVCASPGSKATFMAAMMENEGVLVVNEPSSSRSKKLVANLERMGVINAVLLQNDGVRLNKFFTQQFDKILLDAPCSSEGFARKDSKFFEKMWAERKIFEAAKLQKKLICAAFEILAPEGEMVYSTCTSAPEENEAVVQFLLDKYPDSVEILKIPSPMGVPTRKGVSKFFDQKFSSEISENVIRIWPHLETENWSSETFFLCKIKKIKSPFFKGDSGGYEHRLTKHFNPTSKILSKNQSAEILARLRKTFGLEKNLFSKFAWLQNNNEIWCTTKEAANFALKNPHRRAGFPVFDKHGNITSVFALHFGKFATKNFVMLDDNQKDRWLAGMDLMFDLSLDYEDGEAVLVKYEWFCLGYGKVQKGGKKLKNKLDRDLVF